MTRRLFTAASMTTVSIIIVSFNCLALTRTCVRSVFDTVSETDIDLIVVDNASSDGTAEAIAHEFPDARVIALDDNVGFGPGCNLGAQDATGEFILLINPDTELRPGSIDALTNFAVANPTAGIWAGRELDSDGRVARGSCWRFPTLWSSFCIATGLAQLMPNVDLFNREAYGGWQRDFIRTVEVVSGCYFLIQKDLWNELGGFDPDYFMYSEEVDLCLRAHRRGARPLLCPGAEIVHHHGKTQPVRADRLTRLLKGKQTYMFKHWRPVSRSLGTLLMLYWALSRHLGLSTARLFTSSQRIDEAAEAWGRVWKDRNTWLPGYPRSTAP